MYGGEWINNDYNFDTVISAIFTLISIQSTENWVNEMWYIQDSIAPEIQPFIGSNKIFDVYSIMQQMFLTLLCLNLFVGVVLDSYNLEKDKLSLNYLLQRIESMWIDNLKLCYSAKPMITTPKTKDKIRNHFIDLCDSSIFQNLILCCIIGNTIALCIKWHQMPQSMSSQLESVNLIFAIIFTIEAIFKIYAYRRNYFRDNWNRFDFSVVLLTWVVQILILTKLPFDVSILGMIARTLRIGRVFRLVKRIKAIQVILQTLVEALPGISAIALLLFLIFFLYAIIGMSQFPFVMWSFQDVYNDQLNLHYNFQDFVTAFLALFRNSTGEAWDSTMFDTARQYSIIYQCNSNADWYSYMNNGQFADGCGLGVIAIIYFYSFYIIAVQIFLNMFIAVIIDAFMDQSQALGMPVNQADVDDFIECWQIFDPNGDGAIQCEDLEKFVVRLAQTKSKIIQNRKRILKSITIRRKYLASLEIPCHQNFRKFLFVDVIQCMSKLVIEQQYIKQEFAEQKQQLTLHNKKVRGQIETDEQNHQDLIKIIEMNKLRNHKQEFKDFISGISLKSSDILSVSELKSAASKISSAKLEKIDINEIDEDNHEVYTSKHYVYGDLIVNCWRDFLEAKAQEINDSNQSKQAQLNEEQQRAKNILENAPIQQ